MAEIKMAGFGGQGILTAGKILISIAAEYGKEVCWTSSYGAAMRGGTASCTMIISDEEIGTPYPTKLDILLAMNAPSYEKYKNDVREGGFIILNSSLIEPNEFPKGVTIAAVDATTQAIALNNERGANIIMLGAMMKATGLMDAQEFGKGLNTYFEKKKRSNPRNDACYQFGINECVITKT